MAVTDEFDTFDVVLDKMLSNKSQLATSSLYPSEMIEVDKQELFNSLFDKKQTVDTTPLTIVEVDALNGYLFEAFTALYYQKCGYRVVLTPRSGDKGIDVLAFGEDENLAIQSKHSCKNIGSEGVNEARGGVKYYEIKYSCKFTPVVFTNLFFTLQAKELAIINGVITIDRGYIHNFIEKFDIPKSDLYTMDVSREG